MKRFNVLFDFTWFWAAFLEAGYALPTSTVHCYMFELTLPQHTIVVPHSRRELRCLGARDLHTLEEVSCEVVAAACGWRIPNRFDELRSEPAVVAAAQCLNPMEQEGFVVVDRNWRRLKIKSAGYVAIHHLKDRPGGSYTARRLLEIARNNEGDEFLAYFPQLARQHSQAHAALSRLANQLADASLGGRSNWRARGEAGPGLKALLKLMELQELTPVEALRRANIKDVERALGACWLELDHHDRTEEVLSLGCTWATQERTVRAQLELPSAILENENATMDANMTGVSENSSTLRADCGPTTSEESQILYANPFSGLGSSSSESDSCSSSDEDETRS